MRIANPIYDVVFKYLMDDEKIARLLISRIIGEEIESLRFLPQERRVDLEGRNLTVYRLDFAATIRTADSSLKQVIIEIQKAKFATDIIRFRKYLGEQYITACEAEPVDGLDKPLKKAIPIITIYFLGHSLDHSNAAVIKVGREYVDMITGERIVAKEEFIECLTHDSYIIQIRYLSQRRRTELELLLSIFDQSTCTENEHLLQVNEEDFPPKYRMIIRRLQKASEEPRVRQSMEMEDEILEELQDLERTIEKQVKTLAEKDAVLAEKDAVLAKKDAVLAEKDAVLAEKEKQIEELRRKLNQKGSG
ncbi:MAG: hypothetical protein JW795_19105 [Chitinivibrionales bacterium]|nr:hypothetical protein [Chitinivibrionales bacterium]